MQDAYVGHGLGGVLEVTLSRLRIFLTVALFCLSVPANAAELNCNSGPLTKSFGGTQWLVYGCDDNASVVIVTAPGNPATPFYFIFSKETAGYRLRGEGTGDKRLTDAALKDLAALSDADIPVLSTQAHRDQSPN